MLTIEHIEWARERIARYLPVSPVEQVAGMNGCFLKLENTMLTHSFKVRGALNAILSLDQAARSRGVLAASSGNHAAGLAYASSITKSRATILMPRGTPQKKVNAVKSYGAEAVTFGDHYDETEEEALRLARTDDRYYISPYNNLLVMAGAGTIGLEILEQVPEVEQVVVCVSGGGLISGVATAIKSLRPACRVIGVCAESAPAMYNIFHGMEKPESWDTLAEALSGGVEAGSMTIPIVKKLVDDIILVTEAQIAEAMRFMLGTQGWLAEGGGCVGMAAVLHGLIPKGKTTCVIISGGNVDLAVLRKILKD
eukprot:jgi/Mesvir1/21170/Mv25442-RA.1